MSKLAPERLNQSGF